MIKFIIHIFKKYSWFRRMNARITYELLAKNISATEWSFMNYGYAPNADEPLIDLQMKEYPQLYPLQMYHYLASKISIEGKTVLEVGSGRGGGAHYLAQAMKPHDYIGMDLAQSAVELANKQYQLPNLKFIQGSAEKIPLEDQSVDVVINVESCHAYGSVDQFLSEVKRVLKPGGHLLLVDFRNEQNVEKMNTLQSQLINSGMTLKSEENITANVIRSIEEEDASKRARIQRLIPKKWQKLFCEFAGTMDSKFYWTLKNNTRLYYRFVLVK